MSIWQFLLVLGSTGLADICWTRYMQGVAAKQAFRAAAWSAAIIAVGSISIISYVKSPLALIPACLGAFYGTFISIITTPKESRCSNLS